MKKHYDPDHYRLAEPEDLPLFRCANATPVAPDGEEWLIHVLSVAHDLARGEGSLTPSRLREHCALLSLHPPHQNMWGAAWARLKAAGWRRGDERTSRTATRNAARESVYLPPGGLT